MPRIGYNPMRWTTDVHHPEKITATTIVYIPFLDGYWKQSLDVLKICVSSMRQSTATPFDLMVFDNGSCAEVQECLLELERQGAIQFLVLSDQNIGKVGAWNVMFPAAPGEIIVYTDSDVLFLPGWLEASLKVLCAFPKAGMITAQPARRRSCFSELNSTTLAEAQQDSSIIIKRGELIPEQYLTAHRLGLGDTEEEYLKRIGDHKDIRLSKGTVSAYVSATHFQFLTTKEALEQVLPFDVTTPVDADERQLDVGINEAGYWRLSTSDSFVHHMGNAVPSAQSGYDGLGWLHPEEFLPSTTIAKKPSSSTKTTKNPLLQYLLERSRVKRVLRHLSVLSYELLSEN